MQKSAKCEYTEDIYKYVTIQKIIRGQRMIRREDFTIDSRDGKTRLYATKWIPEGRPICVLQIIHGMNDYIDRYEEMAQYLAQRGVLVVGDDHLGHGKSVPEGGQYGYFCKQDAATVLVRDEHRLKKTIQSENPGTPYLIFGHSMGSFILRNYLMRYGKGIQGAIICGTGNPTKIELLEGKVLTKILGLLHGDHYVSKLIDNITAKAYMGGIENPKTKYDWVCTDGEVASKAASDPMAGGFIFSVNGYQALFELASRMQDEKEMQKVPKKLPVLIVSGAEDAVGSFGKAPQKLYDDMINLDMTKVSLKIYNGCRHEIFKEPIKETVFNDLYNFISVTSMEQRM